LTGIRPARRCTGEQGLIQRLGLAPVAETGATEAHGRAGRPRPAV